MSTSVLFFGTPDFSVPTLQALVAANNLEVKCVITQPDKPAGRGNKLTASPVKNLALEHNIPLLQPASIKKELASFLEQASKFGPFDIGVIIAFGQILPQAVLDLPKLGCLNIHASILPRWRGAAPIQRAILAGDQKTGISLMQMELGLDSGPVYAIEEIAIENSETAGSLHDKLAILGASSLTKNIDDIVAGRTNPQIQDKSLVTYAKKITPSEGELDWSKSAKELELQVRGFSPFPGAFTYINGKRLKVIKAKSADPLFSGDSTHAAINPGQISCADKDRLEVQTGSGILSLQEVQLEGRSRMLISDFIRGTPMLNAAIAGSQTSVKVKLRRQNEQPN